MIVLSEADKEALRECFAHGVPVPAKELAAMTALDIRQLKEADVVKTLGRWGEDLYQGKNFPQ